jgi:hypothetical protein
MITVVVCCPGLAVGRCDQKWVLAQHNRVPAGDGNAWSVERGTASVIPALRPPSLPTSTYLGRG